MTVEQAASLLQSHLPSAPWLTAVGVGEMRQGLAGARITMKTKRPILQWLEDWKANRPRYHNYSGTEGDRCFGPAEDDVQKTTADAPHPNGVPKKRGKNLRKS